jgi:hypothetical protein
MALQNLAAGGVICTEPAVTATSGSAIGGRRIGGTIANWARNAFDPYRPELHYMRGPGPKWRERHTFAEPSDRGRR